MGWEVWVKKLGKLKELMLWDRVLERGRLFGERVLEICRVVLLLLMYVYVKGNYFSLG